MYVLPPPLGRLGEAGSQQGDRLCHQDRHRPQVQGAGDQEQEGEQEQEQETRGKRDRMRKNNHEPIGKVARLM